MDQLHEMTELEGLGQILLRRDVVRRRPFGIAAHQDEGDTELPRGSGKLEAGLAGNASIRNDQVDGLADENVFGDRDAARLADAKIGGSERTLDDFEDHRIVVDDKDMLGRHGTIKGNSAIGHLASGVPEAAGLPVLSRPASLGATTMGGRC